MPFDRRIIVQVEAAGTRNDEGEYVPGAVTLWECGPDAGTYPKNAR